MKSRKPEPIIVADLFPDTLRHLVSLLESLIEAEWGAPTACAGWSVKDVALHLLGDEIGMLSRKRDGYHGVSIQHNSWDELVAGINMINQSWVSAMHRMSPKLVIDLMQYTGMQVCDYFRTLDPYATGGPVSWAGPNPAPVWLDLAREYTERWHHQQHIRDAVGKPGLKEPRYLRPVLATFMHALPHAYRNARAPNRTFIEIEISGDAGGTWILLKQDAGWKLSQKIEGVPITRILIHQEDAWRLFTKGLDKNAAAGRIQIDGDPRLGGAFLAVVAILA